MSLYAIAKVDEISNFQKKNPEKKYKKKVEGKNSTTKIVPSRSLLKFQEIRFKQGLELGYQVVKDSLRVKNKRPFNDDVTYQKLPKFENCLKSGGY